MNLFESSIHNSNNILFKPLLYNYNSEYTQIYKLLVAGEVSDEVINKRKPIKRDYSPVTLPVISRDVDCFYTLI